MTAGYTVHSDLTPKKAGKANRIRAVSRFLAGRFSYLRGIVSDFQYLRGLTDHTKKCCIFYQ